MSFFLARAPYQLDNAGRGPSGGIWYDLPDDIRDPSIGIVDGDDFVSVGDCPGSSGGAYISGAANSVPWNNYSIYAYADAALNITDGATQGGAITYGSDGDNEGLALQRMTGSFGLSSSYKKLWFECRVKVSTIADTNGNLFIGLMEPVAATAAIPITTSDVLAAKNFVGFLKTSSATASTGPVVRAVFKKGSGTVYAADSSGTTAAFDATNITTSAFTSLAATTYVKLGFKFNPSRLNAHKMALYVNGVEQTSFYFSATDMTTNWPTDKLLGFCTGVMNSTGTTPMTATLDWWMAAQLL